jgi:hypothetical protein
MAPARQRKADSIEFRFWHKADIGSSAGEAAKQSESRPRVND